MKKSIFKLSLLLIVFGLSLMGCDKDDNGSSEPEVVTATVKYSIPDRYDLLKYVDMTVYYTNNEGKEVSEAVTSATWEKSLTKAPVPGTYAFKVVYTRNKTLLEQESYKLGTGLILSYTTSNGNFETQKSTSTITISKDKIEEYLKKITEEKTSIEIKK